MALAAASEWATFDDTVNVPLDLADVMHPIFLVDDQIIAKFAANRMAKDTTHRYSDDILQAGSVVAAEGAEFSATDVTLDVTTGHGARVRIGARLRDTAAGKSEQIEVTAISTDALTVVRGIGNSTGETHAADATWEIVSMPKQEGADSQNSLIATKTQRTNFSEIHERGIYLTGSYVAREFVVPKDALQYEIGKKMMELKRELARSIIMGHKSADAGSDTVYRAKEGIYDAIRYTTGSNYKDGAQALAPATVEDLIQDVWNDGGSPNLLMTTGKLYTKIVNFFSNNVRYAPSDRVRGVFVNKYLSTLGFELELLASHWAPAGSLFALDTSRIVILPFRSFAVSPLAKTGDAFKWQILGEYTAEIFNRGEGHGLHENLT